MIIVEMSKNIKEWCIVVSSRFSLFIVIFFVSEIVVSIRIVDDSISEEVGIIFFMVELGGVIIMVGDKRVVNFVRDDGGVMVVNFLREVVIVINYVVSSFWVVFKNIINL